MRRWWSAGVVVAVAVACIDLTTDTEGIAAIEFSQLPWPSIVAGDTLRDASGAPAPLAARVFDGEGDITTGPIEFLPQRATLRVVNGNQLVADDTATGSVGLIASTTGIQSDIRLIEIVQAPDTIASDPVAPLRWVVPDDPTLNTSDPIAVRLLSATNAPVRSWIVTFQLEAGGRIIAPGDTSQIFLVGDNGRPSYADTTDASGRAARRVRLRVVPGLTPPDSVLLTARASYRGMALKGSPLTLVLPLVAR